MDIRRAGPLDARAIAMLDAKAYMRAVREQRFHSICNESGTSGRTLLVLWEGSVPRAFIDFHQVIDEVTVRDIAVDPECQGQGFASALLKRALERMKADGAHRCLLEVRASNRTAIALYRGHGFTVDSERKGYYPTESGRESALLMSVEL